MKHFRFFVIYQTTNLISGKIYVGQHRTNLVCDGYLGSSIPLMQDIKKYGKHNFKRIILALCKDENDLNKVEAFFVTKEFVNRPDTYNQIIGGICGNAAYSEISKLGNAQKSFLLQNDIEFQKRFHDSMSQAQRKLRRSNEYSKIREKLRAKMKELNRSGKIGLKRPHTEIEIENMKRTFQRIGHQQGSKNSSFGSCWIHNTITNKRVKVSEKQKYLDQGWILGRCMKLGLNNMHLAS